MLHHSGLGPKTLAKVMSTVIYLKARFLHKAMNGMAPKQAWSGKKLSMNQLKVFGCVVYTQRLDNKRIMLDAKSI
jgi:hypothetical protein